MSPPQIASRFFVYEKQEGTEYIDKPIVSVYRLTQLLIVGYIFGYILLYEKGYQKIKEGDVFTTSKVKGVILTDFSSEADKNMYHRIWDSEEVSSTSESSEFFVATNVIMTPNQVMGNCDENPYVDGANCTDDTDCEKGIHNTHFHGYKTGECIPSSIIPGQNVCEIIAWCPVENDEEFPVKNSSLLKDAADFTVLIRSEVSFYYFGDSYKRNNMMRSDDPLLLKNCRYDSKREPYCPIFTVKKMVEEAKQNFTNMSILGGIILVHVKWNCDLDRSFDDYCKPKYVFRRVDNDGFNPIKGYSFRKAYYYESHRRTLVKYYGIKFIIKNEAIGRKFSLLRTSVNIAIGLALLRMSNHITNVIMWIRKRMGKQPKKLNSNKAEKEESQSMLEKDNPKKEALSSSSEQSTSCWMNPCWTRCSRKNENP